MQPGNRSIVWLAAAVLVLAIIVCVGYVVIANWPIF